MPAQNPITLRELHRQLTELLKDCPDMADREVLVRDSYKKGRGYRTQYRPLIWAYHRTGIHLPTGEDENGRTTSKPYAYLNIGNDSIDGKEYA